MTDREKLMKLIDELPPHEGKTFEEALADHLIANGVNIAQVVHSAWVWGMNRYKQHGAWCKNCGCGWEYKPGDFARVQGLVNAHKYCPNCGAKMDK